MSKCMIYIMYDVYLKKELLNWTKRKSICEKMEPSIQTERVLWNCHCQYVNLSVVQLTLFTKMTNMIFLSFFQKFLQSRGFSSSCQKSNPLLCLFLPRKRCITMLFMVLQCYLWLWIWSWVSGKNLIFQ